MVGCVILFLVFFIWPTMWVHSQERVGVKAGTISVHKRVNRFTGQQQTELGDDGVDGNVKFD